MNLAQLDPRRFAAGNRKAGSAVLGLALDGHRLEAVVVKRSNGSVRVQNTFATSLELNLLTQSPDLVGREIRNHLDRAGIRERACVVCLPLDWALTLHVQVPDLPEADVQSFLDIEAERGLPFGPETLATVSSLCRTPEGGQSATLIAIPKENLFTLQKVLKAAQLRPLSFSLGLPTLEEASRSAKEGVAAINVGDNSVELQVTYGGGISALRTLHGALEQDGIKKKPYADVVARDLRITLGQLPSQARQMVRRLKIFGTGNELDQFVEELAARAKGMGLEVDLVKHYAENDFPVQVPSDAVVSSALSLATRWLSGKQAPLEFLPPKISPWKQITDRYSSGKLAWTGGAVGAVILLVIAAFLVQQWQLSRWRTAWTKIKPRVTELENMQQQIRQFRPWFDESFRSLSILKKVTEAFPEDGAVSANRIEIRDPGIVICSGTAKDQRALLKVIERLNAEKSVTGVSVEHVRGKQFTLNFRWVEGGAQ